MRTGAFAGAAVTLLTYREAFTRFDGGVRQVTGAHATAGIFADYRLRVAAVIRDYGMNERAEAPPDSRVVHG